MPASSQPTIYEADHPFPGVLYTPLSVQKLSGYTILLLKLHPVQYTPDIGELTCYTRLTVNVEYVSTSEELPIVPSEKARVQALIDNPRQLESYPDRPPALSPHRPLSIVSPDTPCDYVIITAQALSSAFQSLIDWKTSRGLSACLYTTEAIYADYTGYDNAEKIRNFIIDAYTTWSATAHPLKYVLLGGDTEIIPVRLVQVSYSGYSTSMPVDMYYAALDGNWDADGDKQFGEPAGPGAAGEEIDFFAEVYVGRMPVETTDEVAHAVSKTVQYEQNPTAEYLDRALWLGRKLDDYTWGGNSKDLVSNLIPQYNVTALYDRDGTYSTARVIAEMNAGVHLVNFDGHGNWGCCPLDRTQVSSLTNTVPFLFYNLGCYTAQFDGSGDEAVAEYYVFTEHGAFAYIGNTRYGWYSVGSTDGPGNQLDRLFFDYAVNTPHHHIGEALQLAKETYYPGQRWSILTLTLLGDPETAVVTALVDPVANISSLLGGKTLRYTVPISGTARAGDAPGATFGHYVLEYGSGSNPSTWTQIGVTGTTPITNGLLAVWDTTVVRDGTYTLRLRVSDGGTHTSTHRHILRVDNLYITSPTANVLVHNNVPLTITGSALGSDFSSYTVAYGRGTNPTQWMPIVTSTVPVDNGVLAVWTPAVAEADYYTIRLTRRGSSYTGYEQVTVYIDPLWAAEWPRNVQGRIVAPAIAAGDLDGDGDLELVATASRTDSNTSYVYAWHYTGQSIGRDWPRSISTEWASAPALADLDRDGDLEVLVGAYDRQVYVWHHDGSAMAGWPQRINGGIFGAPSVADLDQDGYLEIVVAALDGYVYAWRYDGSAMPGWPQATGGSVYASPALGDLDGDGNLEIIVARQGAVYVWRHDGTALTGWPISVTTIVTDVFGSPVAGDIDGNGDLEILVAAGTDVYAWQHNGSAVPGWPQPVVGTVKSSPALGDLDNDGDLEVVVGSDMVYAWYGNGTLLSGWPVSLTMHTNSSPVLGDISGDGQVDVIIGAGDKDARIYAWHINGSAISGWPRRVSALGGATTYQERFASPVLGDLDRDGDIETAIGAEGDVFVFDLSAPYNQASVPWPILQYNPRYTGVYTNTANMPPFVSNVMARPWYVSPGSAVTVTAYVSDENGVASVTAEIESPDETGRATLTLYDDGMHGDQVANDGIYGNVWTTLADKRDYLIDIAATDVLGKKCAHNNVARFTSTDVPYVRYKSFTINEEGIVNGVVNPGEFIRGAITLENVGVMNAVGVTATVSTLDSYIGMPQGLTIAFGDIAVNGSSASSPYAMVFGVSTFCPHGHRTTFDLNIYDQAGNHWQDRFEIVIIDNLGPRLLYAQASPSYTQVGQPVTITASLNDSSGVRSAQAIIKSSDGAMSVTLPLAQAGEMFSGVWTTDNVPRMYLVDLVAEDELGNTSTFVNKVQFTTRPFVKTSDVLLVLDEPQQPWMDILTYYTRALDALAVSYDIWYPLYGVIDADTLQSYTDGIVIWAMPAAGHLSTSTVQQALIAYLDAGGRLFITGQDVGQYCQDTDLYAGYLHAKYEMSSASYQNLSGISGDPIGDGLQFSISGGDGAGNQSAPDQITPLSPAVEVLRYTESRSPIGALRVDTGTYRVVYFAFGFEGIAGAQNRTLVMYRVLCWLREDIVNPFVSFTAVPDSGAAPLTVTMTGTPVGLYEPYTVTWDFGDGQVETPAALNVTHVYTRPGVFQAVLTVRNSTTTVSATHPITVWAQVFLPIMQK